MVSGIADLGADNLRAILQWCMLEAIRSFRDVCDEAANELLWRCNKEVRLRRIVQLPGHLQRFVPSPGMWSWLSRTLRGADALVLSLKCRQHHEIHMEGTAQLDQAAILAASSAGVRRLTVRLPDCSASLRFDSPALESLTIEHWSFCYGPVDGGWCNWLAASFAGLPKLQELAARTCRAPPEGLSQFVAALPAGLTSLTIDMERVPDPPALSLVQLSRLTRLQRLRLADVLCGPQPTLPCLLTLTSLDLRMGWGLFPARLALADGVGLGVTGSRLQVLRLDCMARGARLPPGLGQLTGLTRLKLYSSDPGGFGPLPLDLGALAGLHCLVLGTFHEPYEDGNGLDPGWVVLPDLRPLAPSLRQLGLHHCHPRHVSTALQALAPQLTALTLRDVRDAGVLADGLAAAPLRALRSLKLHYCDCSALCALHADAGAGALPPPELAWLEGLTKLVAWGGDPCGDGWPAMLPPVPPLALRGARRLQHLDLENTAGVSSGIAALSTLTHLKLRVAFPAGAAPPPPFELALGSLPALCVLHLANAGAPYHPYGLCELQELRDLWLEEGYALLQEDLDWVAARFDIDLSTPMPNLEARIL